MKIKIMINELIGWLGTILVFTAYLLLSMDIINSSDLLYQVLNAFGAICIMYISFEKKTYQTGVLNLVWLVIAVISIIKLLISKL